MNQKISIAALGLGMILNACDPPQGSHEDVATKRIGRTATEILPDVGSVSPSPGSAATGGSNMDAADREFMVPKLTPEAERGVKGARNFLLSFASAIEHKKFEQAWSLLSAADKQKWSSSTFAAIFADLGKITIAIPVGTTEGAAGSIFYTAPVTITATDRNGRPVRIEGQAVLRRVNEVFGASPSQLRWHFETLTLDWVH